MNFRASKCHQVSPADIQGKRSHRSWGETWWNFKDKKFDIINYISAYYIIRWNLTLLFQKQFEKLQNYRMFVMIPPFQSMDPRKIPFQEKPKTQKPPMNESTMMTDVLSPKLHRHPPTNVKIQTFLHISLVVSKIFYIFAVDSQNLRFWTLRTSSE